jgi:hypothetical protein
MVLETLVFSPFNHLTQLVAREDLLYLVAVKAPDHTVRLFVFLFICGFNFVTYVQLHLQVFEK